MKRLEIETPMGIVIPFEVKAVTKVNYVCIIKVNSLESYLLCCSKSNLRAAEINLIMLIGIGLRKELGT